MGKQSHGMDIVAMGDTGDANVVTLTLMLLLNPSLSHTTMYTILIIPTIILEKDPLMPSLSHGMDIEDTVDTGDKIKVDDGTNFPLRQNEKAYGSDNNKIVLNWLEIILNRIILSKSNCLFKI